jgi:undecaprenyl-phosphate 4-deoxy-4-formamido-L-arabinose transferase
MAVMNHPMPHSLHSHDTSRQQALSIVIPVYRSEGCLVALYDAIAEALTPTGLSYELILVNDSSPDQSWKVIESICQIDPRVVGVDLRRNFGQDNAILTGLRLARGKYIAIMDDDLQHHPKFLPVLLDKIEDGADVVYAHFRTKRQKLWKNIGSWINGKIAEWVLDKPGGIYISPYKVIRKDVAEMICNYQGPAPYIDGLIFQITSRIEQVPVEHYPRFEGRGNFTFLRSLGVSARLAFSFSARPLRLISWCGFAFAGLGLMLVIGVVCYRLFFPERFTAEAVGWASLMVAILFACGLQMIFFGVLGEYTGRTYLLVSRNPQTAIREVLNRDVPNSSMPGTEQERFEEVSVGRQSDL